MKNAAFWDVRPCGSCRNERCSYLADSCHLDDKGDTCSETSVLTRATRRNIPEDGILHSDLRGILKSLVALTG
jgi:hypothetical protein